MLKDFNFFFHRNNNKELSIYIINRQGGKKESSLSLILPGTFFPFFKKKFSYILILYCNSLISRNIKDDVKKNFLRMKENTNHHHHHHHHN